ncbi:MAG TPA: hypothetical protein ACFYDZ_00330 [Candidatus Brocadiaceae bacterium]
MPISYFQAPEPIWSIIGLNGRLAGGAKMYTYSSLNNSEPKAVYQDEAGTIPYTNPVIFNANGTNGPFFWKVDSTHPDDLYFIQVFDANGVDLIWQVDDYPGSSGSGGGGGGTTYISLRNYISNNQFINHADDDAGPLPTNLLIAPSNHKGFTPAQANPLSPVGGFGTLGPDIRFVKNNTNAVDSVSFPTFALANAPLTGDVTPVSYIRYVCNNTPTGEMYKCFQFPITQKVKNLSNQQVTFRVWAAVTTTPATINIYTRQYYGSGTASTGDVRSTAQPMVLTTTWTAYSVTFVVPSVAAGSLGTPGQQTDDDALYIQIEMPLGSACDILFTKPSLYLGTVSPNIEFDSYDQIDSIDQTPRTGDVKTSYWSNPPQGWLAMNDSTIGNVGSGALNRANQDTFQLYSTLYTTVSDTYAPVSGGRTAPGNTMANAIADFIAGKTMTLPRTLGRALAESGSGSGLTGRVLGQFVGGETVVLTGSNLPVGTPYNPDVGTGSFNFNPVGAAKAPANNTPVDWSFGVATPTSIIQPTSFMNVFIKL